MPGDVAEFISRFLYQLRADEFYGNPGSAPAPEIINQASVAAKDELGFDTHRTHFAALAEIIDACVAEELTARGNGTVASNAANYPRIIAFTRLDPLTRAGIAAAAAQGLVWMEQCRPLVQDHALRNQTAKRVMIAILVSAVSLPNAWSISQMSALARLGASLQDDDLFALRARGAIIEILAANSPFLPRDEPTRAALRQLLNNATTRSNPQPISKAINKLAPLA